MIEHFGSITTRFFEGVRQYWQTIEGAFFVDGLGELGHGSVVPLKQLGLDGKGGAALYEVRLERVPDDVTK